MKHSSIQIIAFLVTLGCGIDGKDLECHYETSGLYVGFTCQLKNEESVLPGTENDGYYFSGLNTDLKQRFDKLFFYTPNISFVPKEAFEVFPNLRKVGFWETDLRIITYEWLTEYLKFEKGLEGLVFYDCHINEIDPRVLDIFARYKAVNLKNNNCIDAHLENASTHIARMNSQMQTCFENFRMRQLERSMKKMEDRFEKFEMKLDGKIDEISDKLTKIFGNKS